MSEVQCAIVAPGESDLVCWPERVSEASQSERALASVDTSTEKTSGACVAAAEQLGICLIKMYPN